MTVLNVLPGCVLLSKCICGYGRHVVRGHVLLDCICLEEHTPLYFHLHSFDSSAHLSGNRQTIIHQQPAHEY